MLLSIDGTFLVQIVNFIAFWVLLNFLFIRPTRKAIEERLHLIATQQREAEELRVRAAALQAQADAILDGGRKKTDEIMRAAAASAAEESHRIERGAADEAAASVALAHATVASERTQATAKQAPFVKELARAMADRATGLESTG